MELKNDNPIPFRLRILRCMDQYNISAAETKTGEFYLLRGSCFTIWYYKILFSLNTGNFSALSKLLVYFKLSEHKTVLGRIVNFDQIPNMFKFWKWTEYEYWIVLLGPVIIWILFGPNMYIENHYLVLTILIFK